MSNVLLEGFIVEDGRDLPQEFQPSWTFALCSTYAKAKQQDGTDFTAEQHLFVSDDNRRL